MTIKLQDQNLANPIIPEIANKEYLGRMPIVGRSIDGKCDVLAYFPTGRSSGSRARFLAPQKDGSVKIDPSKDAKPGQGNPALIYYTALELLDNDGIVVTNGAQTNLVTEVYRALNDRRITPIELLQESFKYPRMMDNFYIKDNKPVFERIDITSFEPDNPNYTPRVSTVLGKDGAAMSIAFCNNGQVERQYFDIPLMDGVARGLPTYTGKNVPEGTVIPHYEGSPMRFPIIGNNAQEFAQALFNSLGPKIGDEVVKPGDDFRVGVVAIFRDRATHTLDYHIINKNEPKT